MKIIISMILVIIILVPTSSIKIDAKEYNPINENSETHESDSIKELNSRYNMEVPKNLKNRSEKNTVYNIQTYSDEFIQEELILYVDGTYEISGIDFSESFVDTPVISQNASWSGSGATCSGDPSFSRTCKNARAYGSSDGLIMGIYFDYTTTRTGKSSINRFYNSYAEKVTTCWLSKKEVDRVSESPTNLYKDTVVFKQNITGGIQQKSLHKLTLVIDHNNIKFTKVAS